MQAARTVYSTAFEAVLQLKRAGKDREAAVALEGQLRPAHLKYVDTVAELMAYRKSSADDKGKAIEATVGANRTGILAVLLSPS